MRDRTLGEIAGMVELAGAVAKTLSGRDHEERR
jgi:hypothetical protein